MKKVSSDDSCNIAEILSHEINPTTGKIKYLVKWNSDYAKKTGVETSKEPEAILENCEDLLFAYKSKHELLDEEPNDDIVDFNIADADEEEEQLSEAEEIADQEEQEEQDKQDNELEDIIVDKGETEEITEANYIQKWLEDNKALNYHPNLVKAIATRLYKYFETLTDAMGELSIEDIYYNYSLILDDAVAVIPDKKEQKAFQKKFELGEIPNEVLNYFDLLKRVENDEKLTKKQQDTIKKILNRDINFGELEDDEVEQIKNALSELVHQLEDELATTIRSQALELLAEFGINLLAQEEEDIKLGDLASFVASYGRLQETDIKIKKGYECLISAIKENKELRDMYQASNAEYKNRKTKKQNKLENIKIETKRAPAASLRPGLRNNGGGQRRFSQRRFSRRRFSLSR